MATTSPAKNTAQLIDQWITRFDAQKKNMARAESITTMKFGANTIHYIKHAAETTLSSSDPRRYVLQLYKALELFLDHINEEKNNPEQLAMSIERLKSTEEHGQRIKNGSWTKVMTLCKDMQKELHHYLQAKAQSMPSSDIKKS